MTKTEQKEIITQAIETIESLVDQLYPKGFPQLQRSLTRRLRELLDA